MKGGTPSRRALAARARRLRLLLLDVDGVLTDGDITYTEGGEESKRFHIHDGMGIDLLARAGIRSGILTGRRSAMVERRARELGMTIIKQGFYDKHAGLVEILGQEGLGGAEVAYVGDDVQDLSVMRAVGFRAAPANAVAEVKAEADYVCRSAGGFGAVREVADLLLTLLGKKKAAVAEASRPGVTPPPGRAAASKAR